MGDHQGLVIVDVGSGRLWGMGQKVVEVEQPCPVFSPLVPCFWVSKVRVMKLDCWRRGESDGTHCLAGQVGRN